MTNSSMGASLSCFGESSSEMFSKHDDSCLVTSFTEFIKHSCSAKNTKKRKLHHLQQQKRKVRIVTLKDLLSVSPSFDKDYIGEYYVFEWFSTKVFRSQENRVMEDEYSFSRGSQTTKTKMKRVSFRLPEESDIFVFYPCDDE